MIPTHIIIHHSLTKDSGTVSWDAIRRYHTSWKYNGWAVSGNEAQELIDRGEHVQRPWRDIGYHYGIELIGGHYEILVGRMETDQGAHCAALEMNKCSIGICLVGNFDIDPSPREQWKAAVDLVLSISERNHIPLYHVYGHGEIDLTRSCPGKRFDMEQFRIELIRNGKISNGFIQSRE